MNQSLHTDLAAEHRKALKMKVLVRTFAGVIVLIMWSVGSNAKVFDFQHVPQNLNQLRNADSFSVECRSARTGMIDRESVDVDAATATVEIPGSEPLVHHITKFTITERMIQDRFGQPGVEVYLLDALWGQIGASAVGLILSSDRWSSHHEDDTWWTCAN